MFYIVRQKAELAKQRPTDTIAEPVHELIQKLLQVARQESRSVKPIVFRAMEYAIAVADDLERPL